MHMRREGACACGGRAHAHAEGGHTRAYGVRGSAAAAAARQRGGRGSAAAAAARRQSQLTIGPFQTTVPAPLMTDAHSFSVSGPMSSPSISPGTSSIGTIEVDASGSTLSATTASVGSSSCTPAACARGAVASGAVASGEASFVWWRAHLGLLDEIGGEIELLILDE